MDNYFSSKVAETRNKVDAREELFLKFWAYFRWTFIVVVLLFLYILYLQYVFINEYDFTTDQVVNNVLFWRLPQFLLVTFLFGFLERKYRNLVRSKIDSMDG